MSEITGASESSSTGTEVEWTSEGMPAASVTLRIASRLPGPCTPLVKLESTTCGSPATAVCSDPAATTSPPAALVAWTRSWPSLSDGSLVTCTRTRSLLGDSSEPLTKVTEASVVWQLPPKHCCASAQAGVQPPLSRTQR